MNKESFYVFSAINGVLFDSKFVNYRYGPFADVVSRSTMKQESVDALNCLLAALEEVYDTKLVITSTIRQDMEDCLSYLSENGLEYNKPIYATELNPSITRGQKVLNVMKQDNLNPVESQSLKDVIKSFFGFANEKKGFSNYVVIDSTPSRLEGIPKSHIIKTNIKKQSLTQKQVESFLQGLQAQPGNE